MQKGKFNILLDAFAGSSGKAKMYCHLADKYRPEILCSTNNPNAGHTYRNGDDKFIAKILPSAAYLHKINPDYSPLIFIGPTAAFTLDQLQKELDECNISKNRVLIHPRAGIITDAHKAAENTTLDGPKSIGSTCQGTGTYLADKILRKPGLKLARDYEELKDMVIDKDEYLPAMLQTRLDSGYMAFHEVAQGIGLDIHHGISYPTCTSRSCNSLQAIADMAPRLSQIGDIYLNIHTTPIRVGNIIEDGKEVGNSGPGYPDQEELTWDEVGRRAGMPEDVIKNLYNEQLTTVTKRLRRVFSFSWVGLKRAVQVSSATKLMVNFAQYIDYKALGVKKYAELPAAVVRFINKVEDVAGLPVVLIGTGPNHDDVINLTESYNPVWYPGLSK